MAVAVTVLLIVTQLASARPTYYGDEVVGSHMGKRSQATGVDRTLRSMMFRLTDLQKDVLTLATELNKNAAVSCLPKKNVCPKDFVYTPANSGCYKVVLHKLDWTAAQRRCRSLHKDAHLVFIESASEQKQIASLMASYSNSAIQICYSQRGKGKIFWTGGQRIDPPHSAKFVWKKNVMDYTMFKEMGYTNWLPGEPNNHNYDGSKESCLELSRAHQYGWNDDKCSLPTCSICEIDL